MPLDRRTLLIGGGAGVGLIVAWAWWPREIGSALNAQEGERVFGHYLKIGLDGRVAVAIPQAETGQGSWTALAQIAADELGAAWENVAVEPAPASPVYANTWLDGRITANATSVRAFEQPLREAAATARDLLIRVAAGRWEVESAECESAGGFVAHEGKRLGFGALAADAARLNPAEPRLRPAGSGRLAGQPLPRLDLPAKSDGTLRFAADVRLLDMRFASARIAPPGGRLTGFERGKGLVATDKWLAAVSESWWAAERALVAARPSFTGNGDAGEGAVDAALDAALEAGDPETLFEQGDYSEAVGSARALAATYRIAPAQHLSLEPLVATARMSAGRLEVWAPVQAYDLAREAAARAAGLDTTQVTLYPMPVGDSGGRALEPDAVAIAVELAKRSGKPIQLTIPANASQNQDKLRPPLLARMAALPSPAGAIEAWSARLATAPGYEMAMARLKGEGPPGSVDLPGGVPPYAIPSIRIEGVAATLPMRPGYMRGGSEALTGFVTESFVDEMARALNADPFAFRMGMLGGNVRLARALTTVTAIGGWAGSAGGSMGVAAVSAFGSHIALLAEAAIGTDQRIEVSRLVAAVDCGRIVNPNLVRQQIEGALLHALDLATVSAPDFLAGMPKSRPIGALRLHRLGRIPQIEVELIASREPPGGVNGLGHTVLAAAVANAIAAGTGRRLRDLPFEPMGAA
jgi:isoquinoline 1-oxidoreductase subunit beta